MYTNATGTMISDPTIDDVHIVTRNSHTRARCFRISTLQPGLQSICIIRIHSTKALGVATKSEIIMPLLHDIQQHLSDLGPLWLCAY